jgi:hypothetical protein
VASVASVASPALASRLPRRGQAPTARMKGQHLGVDVKVVITPPGIFYIGNYS